MTLTPRDSGWIEVICGSMFSGKTEELIRRLRRAQIAQMEIAIFKPKIDSRYSEGYIVSHNHIKMESYIVDDPNDILDIAKEGEHPRAYEVAGQLIKNVSEVTELLVELQEKMKKLKEVPDIGPKNVTNALFVGSTKELQKMLKQDAD